MMMVSKAAMAAAIALALATPVAAQQPAAPGTGGPNASVPPATVAQAGAALREVTAIRENFSPQIASAKNDSERQGLQQRAMDAAVKAINDQGLSVDRYNEVMRQAQADPALGEQVLAAARTPR